jgi:hypothetical protein
MHHRSTAFRALSASLALVLSGCVSGLLPMQSLAPRPTAKAAASPDRDRCVARVNETARANNSHRTQTYAIGFVLSGVSSILAGLSASAATPQAQAELGPVAVYVPAAIGAGLALAVPIVTSNARADTLTREYSTLSNELEQSDTLSEASDPSDVRRRDDLLRQCAQGHSAFTVHPPAVSSAPSGH